ncbi:MAG: hypothetical protein ACM3IK_03720 [Sphingomonadaceae bacterium]
MMLLQEKVLLAGGTLLEIELDSGGDYRLRYGELVEYANGRRRLGGRSLPYEFRSVEQLRYDFERDVEEQGGRLGEAT